jgi:hypothetical protein
MKLTNTILHPPPQLPRTENDCQKHLAQWAAGKETLPAEFHQRFDKFMRNLNGRLIGG